MSKSRSRTNDTQKALWRELKAILEREEKSRKLDKRGPKRDARSSRKSPPKPKPKPKRVAKPPRPTTLSVRDFGKRKKQARKEIIAGGKGRYVSGIRKDKKLYIEKFLYETQGDPMPLDAEQIGVVQAYFYPHFTRRRIYMITGVFTRGEKNFERSMGRMKLATKADFFDYVDSLFLFMEEFQNKKRYGSLKGVLFLGAVLEKISLRSNAA